MRGIDAALKQPQTLHQYIADACTALTRRLFAANGNRPNRNNWRSTGFWQRMAGGTLAVATNEAATVRMPREVAQRYFGGTLYPTGGRKFLAIPARQEAAGKSPLDFPGLKFIPTGPDNGVLVQEQQTVKAKGARARKDGSFRTEEIGGGEFISSAVLRADKARARKFTLP